MQRLDGRETITRTQRQAGARLGCWDGVRLVTDTPLSGPEGAR